MTNAARSSATPYEVCFGSTPRIGHLQVFGSLGYAHMEKENRRKMDAKSYKCMHLGYSDHAKAYRVLDISSNKVKLSSSLVVNEREVDDIYIDTLPQVANEIIY